MKMTTTTNDDDDDDRVYNEFHW